MHKITDVCYGKSKNKAQYLDVYLPSQERFPVVIHFHGGGLNEGDKANQELFYEYLANNGIAVVAPNYRLYPESKYPDYLIDAAEAVSWVHSNIGNYGTIEGIYVGGSSAGGYISQMLCFDRRWLGEYNLTPLDFKGFILDAGQPTCHFNVLRERGIDNRRIIVDDSAPLYHVGEDDEYPPMLIIVSDNDLQNRLEQTYLLVSTLKHFGHEDNVTLKVMHGTHCDYVRNADQDGNSVLGKLVYNYIYKKLNLQQKPNRKAML